MFARTDTASNDVFTIARRAGISRSLPEMRIAATAQRHAPAPATRAPRDLDGCGIGLPVFFTH